MFTFGIIRASTLTESRSSSSVSAAKKRKWSFICLWSRCPFLRSLQYVLVTAAKPRPPASLQERPWPRDTQEDDSTAAARESFISLALGHRSRYYLASAQSSSSLSHQSTKQLLNGAILESREWFMNVSFPPEVTPTCTDIKSRHFVRCEQTDTDDKGLWSQDRLQTCRASDSRGVNMTHGVNANSLL